MNSRQKNIESSNPELERFVYVASHDLQEPLRKIGGFTKRLQEKLDGQLDDQAQTYMSFIIGGVDRMNELLQGLLSYSRITTSDDHIEALDANEIVRCATESLNETIEENGAKIHFSNLPTVYYDKLMLTRMFQNLIDNAIKYRSEETPEITVTACDTGDNWEFSVQDNGIGIDEKNYELVFQIFKRLHRKEEIAGTGIGLPICEKIVTRYGGEINLASELGKGTTVNFTIPKDMTQEHKKNP